jgi:hypothetical protein
MRAVPLHLTRAFNVKGGGSVGRAILLRGRQRAEGKEQRAEGKEQKTEDREQKTEDREQKTEDREQKTESRRQGSG